MTMRPNIINDLYFLCDAKKKKSWDSDHMLNLYLTEECMSELYQHALSAVAMRTLVHEVFKLSTTDVESTQLLLHLWRIFWRNNFNKVTATWAVYFEL